jgi:hypothetical protein
VLLVTPPELHDKATGRIDAQKMGDFMGVPQKRLSEAGELKKRCHAIYDALVERSTFVNCHRIEKGASAVLALSFYE